MPPSNKRKPERDPVPKRRKRDADEEDEENEEAAMVPASLTRKIISQARQQQEEMESMEQEPPARVPQRRGVTFAPTTTASAAASDDDDDDDDDGFDDGDDEEEITDEYYDVDDVELDDEQQRAMDLFMGSRRPQNLADIIMEKIAQKEEEARAAAGGAEGGEASGAELMPELPPKVLEVYQGVGKLLSRYRSGKLPKAFKIIPQLTNWEEVLYVTQPDDWTPAAMREATRLFASNMNPRMAQRFFNLVLLPAVQDDIRNNKKLNFHYCELRRRCPVFPTSAAVRPCRPPDPRALAPRPLLPADLALKKSLYKPASFFKGVLLPLGESRCTLREALIVASVLSKVSVPVLHSAVAILKLTEMDFCGANALFLRTLLLKKYALPYRVIDQLVDFFVSFTQAEEVQSLLWQQSLLAFAQHYKTEVTKEQKNRLKALLRVQNHPMVTPEIRRELFSARNRGDPFVALAGVDADMAEA
jgi:essential nuclear protein 1